MLVTAYHASTDLFDQFVCTKHGIHLGSIESAREAVSRKPLAKLGYYLYEVEVDISSFVEEIDHGHDWFSIFENESDKIFGYVYQNKYEPSSKPSYVTWMPEKTLRILSVNKKFIGM